MTSLSDVVLTGRGYLTRGQILDSGYTDRDIRAVMRAGLLTRLRHGVYAFTADYRPLSPGDKHVLLARSVADKLGPGVALSHDSACATHGIALLGADLSRVHVTRLDGSAGRSEHGIVHHVGQVLAEDDVEEVDGILVVKPRRAVFESAMIGTVEAGIVAMDSALHRRLVTPDDLAEMGRRTTRWQGARSARYAASLADGRAESPGESRSRYLFRREGLPVPDLQVEIHDDRGRLIGRTDFAWLLYRHLGEFDGLIKFGGLPGDPRSPQVIAFEEKVREDDLRAQLLGMSRWTWSDIHVDRQRRTAARVRAELERSRQLYTGNRVVIPLG